MKGKNIKEFLDSLSFGDEMEFTYKGRNYLIQGVPNNSEDKYIVISNCDDKGKTVYESPHCKSYLECVKAFKESPILEGKTIFELEQDITVEYG